MTDVQTWAAWLLTGCQVLGWITVGCFGLHQLWILSVWLRHVRRPPAPQHLFAELPVVTIQLPIFNERYVVARLLRAIAALDYPRNRLDIQVLDDSTDDTTALVAIEIARLQAQGFAIRHLHRSHRQGFKAGALAEGLRSAAGEYIALFDADFVPQPDFLQRMVHFFTDPKVAMVQGRWGHLNRGASWLTRGEGLILDGHFLIEQVARSRGGFFFNFNGSAGMWRKAAIDDAGGWQADTLTEDLDLSYRAQMRGWRAVFVSDVVVPAELPPQMTSLKAQQHRWTKGSIQTALKLLPSVWASQVSWPVKLAATFHLCNWFHYPLGIFVVALILPSLVVSQSPFGTPLATAWGGIAGLVLFGTTIVFYSVAAWLGTGRWWRGILEIPVLMAINVGVALNNTRAIWEAVRGTPSSFNRTPKYSGLDGEAGKPGYRPHRSGTRWWWTEVAFGLYVCAALAYASAHELYGAVPFLVPLSAGFFYAGFSSFAVLVPTKTKPATPALQPVRQAYARERAVR